MEIKRTFIDWLWQIKQGNAIIVRITINGK